MDKKSASVLRRLHKGLGVRGNQLSSELAGTQLAQRWLIAESDPDVLVRAKVSYRLAQVFTALSPPDSLVWPVVYNTELDLRLHHRDLGARLDELPARFPDLSIARRSADRVVQRLCARLEQHVESAVAGPFEPDRLARMVRAECEFAEQVRDGRAFDRLVAATFQAPLRSAQLAFLDQPTVVSVSDTGQLMVVRSTMGDWVCAFGDAPALRAYRAGGPRGEVATFSGAELVRTVHAHTAPIGVVFRPTPDDATPARTTLALTPDELADLVTQL